MVPSTGLSGNTMEGEAWAGLAEWRLLLCA
jgi:hypothetical protein